MSQPISENPVNASEHEKKKKFKMPSEVTEHLHTNGTDTKENASSSENTKNTMRTRSRSKTPLVGSPSPDLTNNSPSHNHNTRSRSKTPQNSTPTPTPPQEDFLIDSVETIPEDLESESELNLSITIDESILEKDDNEIIPELQFDENEIDIESEGSPNRCKTRRSQLTTASTPKTPKLIEDEDLAVILLDQDASDTQSTVSLDNVSTTAVAGSDTRNVDLSQESLIDENADGIPDRSLTLKETLRNISPRRTIRSVNANNYRKFALTNSTKNHIVPISIPEYDPVQRVAGVKRKSTSIQLNEPKKIKESSGFFSYMLSPIRTLKNSFTTPKLKPVDYEEEETDQSAKFIKLAADGDGNAERQRCSIM